MAQPSKAKTIERLRRVLNKVPELKKLSSDSPEFKNWHRNVRVTITNAFGQESSHIAEFNSVNYSPLIFMDETQDSEFQEAYVRGLERAASVLESMIDEIEEYWGEDDNSPYNADAAVIDSASRSKVFVIHSRDEAVRETVARFLEKLGLEPVILHEQANKGRTIIEKFEDHAGVAFAVVLLTPDDIGGLKDKKSDLKPRARQNVILELGFFLGKLDRRRVCPLVKGDVETPSDYDGVVYTKLDDAGGWKMKLVRELNTAGFDVDANKVI